MKDADFIALMTESEEKFPMDEESCKEPSSRPDKAEHFVATPAGVQRADKPLHYESKGKVSKTSLSEALNKLRGI